MLLQGGSSLIHRLHLCSRSSRLHQSRWHTVACFKCLFLVLLLIAFFNHLPANSRCIVQLSKLDHGMEIGVRRIPYDLTTRSYNPSFAGFRLKLFQ